MRGLLFSAILVVIITAAGCDGEDNQALLVPTEYTGWASTVDGPLVYQIPGHIMEMRRIYINDVGTNLKLSAREGQVQYEYPEGTIIVKENYLTETSTVPTELTVMIKSASDMRARGGWIWVAKNVATGGERVFSDEFCFTCHQNANERHPYGDGNENREYRDFVYYPWPGKL
jgi:hypothetical protein